MPRFVPVPWLQWKHHRVSGVVVERESRKPLPGLMVNAFDKDVFKDDYLGQCETDAEGRFEIRFSDADFKDLGEAHPDLYLSVYRQGRSSPIHDTSYAVRQGAGEHEYFEIEIAAEDLG